MTDRELLELAAKAAGYEFLYVDELEPRITSQDGGTEYWNPLTNDGDALRLAVKLKIIVTFADGGAGLHVCAGRRLGPFSNESIPIVHFLEQQEIDLAATRRAIMRAAAEIGKVMPDA